jgi:hypothetical protein
MKISMRTIIQKVTFMVELSPYFSNILNTGKNRKYKNGNIVLKLMKAINNDVVIEIKNKFNFRILGFFLKLQLTADAMASAGINCCSTVCQHKCI